MEKQKYIQRKNCSESQVNELMKEGYVPWQITTQRNEILKQGNLTSVSDVLVYHFILKKEKKGENI